MDKVGTAPRQKYEDLDPASPKVEGASLFIFHVPNEWSQHDLFNYFESHRIGRIVGTYVSRNPGLPTNKGFGFVNYASPEEAEMAV